MATTTLIGVLDNKTIKADNLNKGLFEFFLFLWLTYIEGFFGFYYLWVLFTKCNHRRIIVLK